MAVTDSVGLEELTLSDSESSGKYNINKYNGN